MSFVAHCSEQNATNYRNESCRDQEKHNCIFRTPERRSKRNAPDAQEVHNGQEQDKPYDSPSPRETVVIYLTPTVDRHSPSLQQLCDIA